MKLIYITLPLLLTSCGIGNWNSADHQNSPGAPSLNQSSLHKPDQDKDDSLSFDSSDYRLIYDLCKEFDCGTQLYPKPAPLSDWKSGSPSSAWIYLHKQIPTMKRSTFDSFFHRNNPNIANNRTKSNVAPVDGLTITISSSSESRPQHFSRAGFSDDRKQALIMSSGSSGFVYLFSLSRKKWHNTGKAALWID